MESFIFICKANYCSSCKIYNFHIYNFFTIGAIYLHICNVGNMIPIFLIVHGCFELVAFSIASCSKRQDICIVTKIFFQLFLVIPMTGFIAYSWLHPKQLSCEPYTSNPNCCYTHRHFFVYFTICGMIFWNIYPLVFCIYFAIVLKFNSK